MSVLGSFLREERERQKLTLKDISDKTAIRAHVLEVLEDGRFDELPSYVHAHGFLAQYVKVLGLDFQGLVKPMFDEECPKEGFGGEQIAKIEKPEAIRQSDFAPKSNNIRILILVALIAVIGIGIFFAVSNMGDEPSTVTPQPTATFGSNTPDVQTPADMPTYPPDELNPTLPVGDPIIEPDPITAPASPVATMRFSGECWVSYVSDDGTTAEFSAMAGTVREVSFNKYFRARLGNAATISVEYNGNTLSGFGGRGQSIQAIYFVLGEDGVLTSTRTAPTN